MNVKIQHTCSGVDWQTVQRILKEVEMAHHSPEIHQKAFEASFAVVFIYDSEKLIGFGRAISDGAYQAAVYDCAVLPEYQSKGMGRIIMDNILTQIPHCNVILYASPGKEGFYQNLGFRKMKTGMAHFIRSTIMTERGFTE